MSLMENGKYKAVTKGLAPYYRPSGNLSVAVAVETEQGVSILARINIELNDGTISDSALKNLCKVFPAWDGSVEGLFVSDYFVDAACEIDVLNETGQNGKTYSNVKWLNPPGGMGGVDLPKSLTKQEMLQKYASKFRAMAGAQKPKPVTKPVPAPVVEDETGIKEAPAPKKAPVKKTAADPKKAAKAPTMEECWNMLQKRCPDNAEELWDKFIQEAGSDKDYSDITDTEWVAIMALCDGTNSLDM